MKTLTLTIALMLAGCIPLQPDSELTRIANQEWPKSGAPASLQWMPVVGHYCIGSPAAGPDAEAKVLRMYIPIGTPDWLIRPLMRYELSKYAYQLRHRGHWLAQVDAALHLPPSEFNSWRYVFSPGGE